MHDLPSKAGQQIRVGRLVLGWTAILLSGGAAPLVAALVQTDSLEAVAERATRSVVIIDVRTAADSRQGSGFLVDSAGRILTNEHVIRGARSIRVKLPSGDVYDAVDILAADERRDIAVIRIAGFNLPALPMGDSDSVRVGAPVVLIGSPLGLENTVTTGIVSARRREAEGYELFQVSAPASRGSSGGPVLSISGRVVGVASSQMQAGQNLNFAVPINYARGLLNHLDGEPLAMLRPVPDASDDRTVLMSDGESSVNSGLRFELDAFRGHTMELETRLGEDRTRRTRVTYRVIETVGRNETRLERYVESETTRRTEPFGTRQTLRRERVRTMVSLADLDPLSTEGEISWWTGEGWQSASYELRFQDRRVRGLVRDTAGRAEELDRELPMGVVPREMRDLAFTALASDSLIGKSIELTTFDPWSGGVVEDRYDILGVTEIEAGGRSYDALQVNVASGLTNSTAYFGLERPGLLLRRVSAEGEEVEEIVSIGDTPEARR
jgi:hypothetical protein